MLNIIILFEPIYCAACYILNLLRSVIKGPTHSTTSTTSGETNGRTSTGA